MGKREICERGHQAQYGGPVSPSVEWGSRACDRRTHQRGARHAPRFRTVKVPGAEAYNRATYVRNRTPTRGLGGLPARCGPKPDVVHLRGAPCAVVKPQAKRKKLDDRASTAEADIELGTRNVTLLSGPERDVVLIMLRELTAPGDDADLPVVQQPQEHPAKPKAAPTPTATTDSDANSDASDDSAPPPQRGRRNQFGWLIFSGTSAFLYTTRWW